MARRRVSAKGNNVKRPLSTIGVRIASVGLLVAGVIGGVQLAQTRIVTERGADSRLVLQAEADEMQLLRDRQNQVAAGRARQHEAEAGAAARAASEARGAARQAKAMETKAIQKKKQEKEKEKAKASGALIPYTGPIPTSCKEYSGNRATGCALMLGKGFGIDQFPCLEKLWDHESGWNAKAENKGSGAYGIPQALPGSKMGSAGSDWRTNAATQIKWGLGYVKGKYKSPCGAWSHFQNAGNY
ncbi:hypothetical protein Acsp02_66750 [Actinoplanes sp. NBRC 103695]|nr:hypothetical protein Acsp02_66750 [Actinoplanes sp. NBRC 103695]